MSTKEFIKDLLYGNLQLASQKRLEAFGAQVNMYETAPYVTGFGSKKLERSIQPASSQTLTSWRKLSVANNTDMRSLSSLKQREVPTSTARDQLKSRLSSNVGKTSAETFYSSRVQTVPQINRFKIKSNVDLKSHLL